MDNKQRIEELLTGILSEAETQAIKESVGSTEREQFIESYIQKRLMQEHPELLEEGWKEIALSLAMLANVALSTPALAQAKQNLGNENTIEQIKSVVNNPAAMQKVGSILNQQGYKDAEKKIQQNAAKVIDQLNKLENKDKVVTKKTGEQGLKQALSQGYAITKVESDTIYKTVVANKAIAPIVDSFSVSLDASKLYATGGFTLSPEGVDSIQSTIAQIKAQGGTVLAIRIESSTDKQRVSPNLQNVLGTKGYSADNQGLSRARNDGAKQALVQMGIDGGLVKQVILAEQGAGQIGAVTPQDAAARYVKIYIDAVKTVEQELGPTNETNAVKSIVNTFELAKVQTQTTHKTNFKLPSLHLNVKHGDVKHHKSAPGDCFQWGK